METKKTKLLLVGWDAADWQIINPLLQQGKLPGIARLMNGSAWGNLVTLDPPISPMLWTSIATGKRPYKHGIHGFTELAPDGKTVRPVRVSSRKCKAVWNILNDFGYKTNVVGWWPSHPAEKVDGAYVSNFYGVAPKENSDDWPLFEGAVFPESLEQELADLRLHPKELTAAIMRNFFPEAERLESDSDPVLRSAMRILAHATSVHAAATHLMENTAWDFTAVYYDALDHFSHLGMKYHPPKLERISESDFKKYHYIVEAAYRFHDMMLDRLLDLAGDNCNVVLVSDHGFESGGKRYLSLPDEPGAPALEHRPYGVFLANGKLFNAGQVYGASLLDVTPTILNAFGLSAAKDMDGRIILDALRQPVTESVESYDSGQKIELLADVSSEIDAELISQLEDLGYLKSSKTQEQKSTILSENEFYLAKSFADGGKLKEAFERVKRLCEAFPNIDRYANYKASLCLRLGEIDELKNWLDKREKSAYTAYLQGMVYLQQGQPVLAAQSFEAIKLKSDPLLMSNTASAWFQSGETDQAKKYATLALKLNQESNTTLNLLGDLAMHEEDWEGALSRYFKSLELFYYQPLIHEKIGKCFYWLNLFVEASQSFEVVLRLIPGKPSAIKQLVDIYSSHVVNTKRLAELQKEEDDFAVVVSGFPRSGTSMMMKMLANGGLEIYSDENRKPDEFNPNGYFELDAVRSTSVDQSYLREANGKAIKIVMPVLRLVNPVIPLKVIWMERAISSTLKSQQNMTGKKIDAASFSMVAKLNKEKELMEAWLNQHPHVSYIKVNYSETLDNPERIAEQLVNFIGKKLDVAEMKRAVLPNLKHF